MIQAFEYTYGLAWKMLQDFLLTVPLFAACGQRHLPLGFRHDLALVGQQLTHGDLLLILGELDESAIPYTVGFI